MTTANGRTVADFWFDPTCPWAWLTSRWMKEVEQVRDVHVRFHVMSLAYLNRDKQVSDSYRERLAASWGPVRVCVAAAKQGGEGVLDPLYTELGTRFHNLGQDRSRATIEQALVAAGLPPVLADAMDTDEYDDLLIASHQEGMAQVGNDVGTPVISVDGVAFFGPVVTPTPRGERAAQLWDGFRMVADVPGFFELKRGRTSKPSFD
jgi:2-hydroxychromene-2-carboxylate isomerase